MILKRAKFILLIRLCDQSRLNEFVWSRLKEYSHQPLLNEDLLRKVTYRDAFRKGSFDEAFLRAPRLKKYIMYYLVFYFFFFFEMKLSTRRSLSEFRLIQECHTKGVSSRKKVLMSKRKLRKSDFISLPFESSKDFEYVKLMLLDLSFFREARLRKLHSYYYYRYIYYRVYWEREESKVRKDVCSMEDRELVYSDSPIFFRDRNDTWTFLHELHLSSTNFFMGYNDKWTFLRELYLANTNFFMPRYDKWIFLREVHLGIFLTSFNDVYKEQKEYARDEFLLNCVVEEDFIMEFRMDPAVKWVESREEKLLDAALNRAATEVLATESLTALFESRYKVEALARVKARAEVLAGAIAVQELKERELN